MPRAFRQPKINIHRIVCNRSDRTGVPVSLIVLHSTESHDRPGSRDVEAVIGWFDNPQSQASSHLVIDKDGITARCVDDRQKAWTCAAFNSASLNIEQIGWSSSSRRKWIMRDKQLKQVAKFIAFWSKKYGIPVERGAVSGRSVVKAGVVMHSELGEAGGNHGDPGKGYPIDKVIRYAKFYKRFGWLAR